MTALALETRQQLFTDARTYNDWQDKKVSPQDLHDIYNLMKWGPTSANLCPARLIFVSSSAEKEKLITTLMPQNVAKVRAAPVTVIIAQDIKFYEQAAVLFPQRPEFQEVFAADELLAERTAFRNSSLQGAYFMLAARTLGFDCGPMSGFDNQKVDELFLAGTTWTSNFICCLGYGKKESVYPRLPRLEFADACKIV